MGKKKGKQNDEDFFASLAASSAAPAEEEEETEEAFLKRQHKAQQAEDARAAKEVEKQAAAANAARAKAMMESRGRKKKNKGADEDDEPAPPPPPPPPAVVSAQQSGADGDEDDASGGVVAAEPLSAFGTVLLALRPFSSECGRDGWLAAVLRVLWLVLSALASASTLAAVDDALRAANPEAVAAIDAEDERRRADELFSPVSGKNGKWFARSYVSPMNSFASAQMSEEGSWERWQKNLKTKIKAGGGGRGVWGRVRDGEGWASAPARLDDDCGNIADCDVRFFVAWEGRVFECTAWVESHLCSAAAARALKALDAPKPLFTVEWEETRGLVAALPKKTLSDLARLVEQQEEEEGASGKSGKSEKLKLSRAEKKQKKQSYGR